MPELTPPLPSPAEPCRADTPAAPTASSDSVGPLPTAAPTPLPRAVSPQSRLLALVAAFALLLPAALSTFTLAPAGAEVTDEQLSRGGVLREADSYRVAPGLDLTTFSRLEDGGWMEGSVLTADLTEQTLSMDVVDDGTVTGRAPLQDVMRSGARGEQAVAAVNGTFFDINHSDAPLNTSISAEGVRVGTAEPMPALTLADGRAAIQALSAAGELTLADGTVRALEGVNNPSLPQDGIGVYTPAWGEYTLDRPVGAPDELSQQVAVATVVDGVVTAVTPVQEGTGDPEIPADGQLLIGREAGAEQVAALTVGEAVDIAIGPDQDVDLGIAGSHQILVDGQVADLGDDPLATGVHPRTAVGISRDGSELFVLVLDGRSNASAGMTLPDLAQLLADMGAHNAVNLDGGGSSAVVARAAGAKGEQVWNTPSDGEVREVPNALVFYSDAPAEQLSDVQLDLALEGEDAVFPGLHRTLTGTGLGANLDPLMAAGEFTAAGSLELAEAGESSVRVAGAAPGSGTVTYTVGAHEDRAELRVLGEAIGMRASERAVNLPDAEQVAELTLTGYDADGQRARIESADVEVEVEGGFTVTDDGLGTWQVRATGESESGTVTFRVGELSTTVALTFGTEVSEVLDLTDPSAFTTETARATGEITAAEGPDGEAGGAIGMTYDFTTASATRGFYLVANEPVTVEGKTLAFTLDVRADGTGAWPRLQVADGNGTVTNLDGDHLDGEGWQTVRFTVPEGLPQPLTVQRIRIMETRPETQYEGNIAVANLQAITTPAVETAPVPTVHDPALLTHGTVEDRPQRIAVLSDAQFVATSPDSDAVAGARRTLQEIRETRPDLLVINGDLVDEASPEDFELAQQILDEEWDPEIPYIYVPGNHEIMGGAISNFEDAFGDTTTERTLGRTRVITLNTATGSLKDEGLDQLRELERQLEEVAESDTLTGAVVFFHHPPADPLPSALSQLSDQREARALERELAEFRRSSGKSVAVVNAHVGVFHGSAVEGVTYLINGNSGKSPAGTPATGGFTGWTMLGISPGAGLVGSNPTTADRVAWLAAETRPWVDEISADGTAQLRVDEVGEVSARFTQDGREVPVAWPVTAQWGGKGVQIDDGTGTVDSPGADAEAARTAMAATEQVDRSAVIRLNPTTGEITGLRPGKAVVIVTVNGRTAEHVVHVAGEGPGPQPEDPEAPGDDAPGEDGDGSNEGSRPGDDSGDDGSEDDGSEGDGSGNDGGTDGDGTADEQPGSGSDGTAPPPAGSGEHGHTPGQGPLARTGAELLPLAAAAIVLITLGVLLARRRRSIG